MRNIKYIVIDVDGTMTDAGIYYDEHGNELKKFCTKDAAGFFAAHKAGMKVDFLCQDVKDKKSFLQKFMSEYNIDKDEVGYIGDDLNDYEPMLLAGYVGCPLDSCPEIIEIADYVSKVRGGYGAVRDIIEHMLRENGIWSKLIEEVYGIGI